MFASTSNLQSNATGCGLYRLLSLSLLITYCRHHPINPPSKEQVGLVLHNAMLALSFTTEHWDRLVSYTKDLQHFRALLHVCHWSFKYPGMCMLVCWSFLCKLLISDTWVCLSLCFACMSSHLYRTSKCTVVHIYHWWFFLFGCPKHSRCVGTLYSYANCLTICLWNM